MYLLGRMAMKDEVDAFATVALSGTQIAYYEPYFNISGLKAEDSHLKRALSVELMCTEKMGFSLKPLSIPDTHSEEFDSRGGKDSTFILALIRSIWCTMPSADVVKKWTTLYYGYKTEDGETEALQRISRELRATGGDNTTFCAGSFNDIYGRLYGREVSLSQCDVRNVHHNCESSNAEYTFDCCEFSLFLNGSVSTTDVIHHCRSEYEYIFPNEAVSCYEQYPLPEYQGIVPQRDPHAIGEYVTQLYRIIAGRRPSSEELRLVVDMYPGGATRNILRSLAVELLAECNSKQ